MNLSNLSVVELEQLLELPISEEAKDRVRARIAVLQQQFGQANELPPPEPEATEPEQSNDEEVEGIESSNSDLLIETIIQSPIVGKLFDSIQYYGSGEYVCQLSQDSQVETLQLVGIATIKFKVPTCTIEFDSFISNYVDLVGGSCCNQKELQTIIYRLEAIKSELESIQSTLQPIIDNWYQNNIQNAN